MKTPPDSFWTSGQAFWLLARAVEWPELEKSVAQQLQASPFDTSIVGTEGKVSVEEARDFRIEMTKLPTQGKVRLGFVEYIDKANAEAANTLLKILEEPPHASRIILLTESRQVLPTIRSRCSFWTSASMAEHLDRVQIPLEKDVDFATVSVQLAEAVAKGQTLLVIDTWTQDLLAHAEPHSEALHWLIEIRAMCQNTNVNAQALLEVTYLHITHDLPLPRSIEKVWYKDHGHI